MKTSPLLKYIMAAALFGMAPIPLCAQISSTWKATVLGGDWDEADNWTNGVVPDGVDAAAWFTPANGSTGPHTINMGADITLGRLILSGYSNTASGANQGWVLGGSGSLNFNYTGGTGGLIDLRAGLGNLLTINSAVKADYGLTIKGNNTVETSRAIVTWNAASTSISGGLVLDSASVSVAAVSSRLGSGDVTLSGTGASRIFLTREGGSSPGVFSNDIKLANNTGSGFVFSYYHASQVWDISITGTIGEQGGARTMRYMTGTSSVAGGRFIVSGNNAYTGNTIIGGGSSGPIVVRATHSNALGTGAASVTFDPGVGGTGALELAGGIRIENKTITLNGDGFKGAGGLNSVSGDNEWAGIIATTSANEHRIGVESGSLKVSGVIHGNRITKVGTGLLELASDNAFTKGFRSYAGTLLISADGALGSGNVEISNSVLAIGKGVHATVDGAFTLNTARLEFDLTDALADTAVSFLTVTGSQIGAGDFLVDLAGADLAMPGVYHLLSVEGSVQASSFTLGGDYQGTLDWENGILTYTVVPEPGSVTLVFLSLAGIGLYHRYRRA